MTAAVPPPIDRWEPLEVAEVVALFGAAPFRWWICGGRALELHCRRRWRSQSDTDLGIRRDEAARVGDWLGGERLWLAVGGELRPWNESQPSAAAGANNVWMATPTGGAWALDITIGAGTDREWIYRRDERIRRPWEEAVLVDGDAVPYLAPELQLLFKARHHRPKDDRDASEVVPMLDADRRRFLRENLDADHPWQSLLGAS